MPHTCPTHMANLQVISHSPWPHSLSSHTLGCLALLTSNSSSRRHLPSSPSHLNAKITSFELISPSLDAQLTSQSLPHVVLVRPKTNLRCLSITSMRLPLLDRLHHIQCLSLEIFKPFFAVQWHPFGGYLTFLCPSYWKDRSPMAAEELKNYYSISLGNLKIPIDWQN